MSTKIPDDVQQAIERSASHNEIVTIEYSDERADALRALCSDWVKGNDVVEYWSDGPSGDDGDMAWRVHLAPPDETPEPGIDEDEDEDDDEGEDARTLAETIAQFALSEGYVRAAIDGGWDPMRYELLGGDVEYLRGQHDDSPAGLPLADEEQHALEVAVEREVRSILAAAVEAARDEEAIEALHTRGEDGAR